MQEESTSPSQKRRSNSQRSEEMRARLVAAAREIFVEKGFAGAGTPEIVRRAEVTRGALYHHFADKIDLFHAVVTAESEALRSDIAAWTIDEHDSNAALRTGTRAYFASMTVPGRCQLLLIDGPATLGVTEMDALDAAGGRAALLRGIREARPDLSDAEAEALGVTLSAAYDRAALAIRDGAAEEPYVQALLGLVRAAMSA